jgi:hypothetical protein
MRIAPTNFQLPMHIAQAYGVGAASSTMQPRAALQATSPVASRLVAGNVSAPVSFEASAVSRSTTTSPAAVFQMYTRAADRIEAATGVRLGQIFDRRA